MKKLLLGLALLFSIGSASALCPTGTAAYDCVQLDGSARLPAVDGSQLTNVNSNGKNVPFILQEGGAYTMLPPSVTFSDGAGHFNIGLTTASTTITFSGGTCTTSCGAQTGVTATATGGGTPFAGTTADLGRVISVNDSGTWKQAIITAQSSSTVCTVTIVNATSAVAYTSGNWVFGTPVPPPFTSSTVFAYFASGVVVTGTQPAGLYQTTFSSSTAGQVFNNTYTTGVPTPNGGPTAFASSAGTGLASTAAAFTLYSAQIPANTLTTNGSVQVITEEWVSYAAGASPTPTGTAGTKQLVIYYGGTLSGSAITGATAMAREAPAAVLYTSMLTNIINENSLSVQVGNPSPVYSPYASSTTVPYSAAINTALAQYVSVSGQLVTSANDYLITNSRIVVYP